MSVLDPNWFNNAVLKGDYAPSLKNVANPYAALQGIAETKKSGVNDTERTWTAESKTSAFLPPGGKK